MPQKQPNFVSSRNYVDVAERFLDVGFWNADLTTGEVRGTDGFFRILGLARGETFSLQRWAALLHPEDREDFRSISPVVAMGVSVSREVRLVDGQRPPRWIRIAVEEPTAADRIVGLVQDAAGEREARAVLYRERARLNAFIDMFGGVFWARDLSGIVADLRGWDRITGQDQFQCTRDAWMEAIHPEDRERVRQVREACARDSLAREVAYRLLYPDGRYREVLARTTPVRQENGTPMEWIGLIEETWRRDAASLQSDGAALRPQQLRAARVILGWSAEQLAQEAGVSTATIRRYETDGEHMKDATVAAILAALARHGLVLTSSSTEMGLRLRIPGLSD
ncbi:PAS domain-containing protein [Shinella pollutisoli]|uniref:histidine kinase n=1 Tax=Shinella pollutisoli TaxID=2250594 RepID=A0ABV7DH79_9HYPH|nr:PAS domain-containing protein [Shinella pollutisoli]